MEILHTLVIELVILVVLAAFLELLVPAGGLSRYVRVVFGLLIIVAVLQAAAGFWERGRAMDLGALSLQSPAAGHEDGVLEAGERRWEESQSAALRAYRDGLARQVKALAGLSPEVEITAVRVELDHEGVHAPLGTIRSVMLVAAPLAGEHGEEALSWAQRDARGETLDRLCRTIAEFYNLEPEQVGWEE